VEGKEVPLSSKRRDLGEKNGKEEIRKKKKQGSRSARQMEGTKGGAAATVRDALSGTTKQRGERGTGG